MFLLRAEHRLSCGGVSLDANAAPRFCLSSAANGACVEIWLPKAVLTSPTFKNVLSPQIKSADGVYETQQGGKMNNASTL